MRIKGYLVRMVRPSGVLVALSWIAFVSGVIVEPTWLKLVLLSAARVLP
jgi:hypothetical protein